MCVCVCVCVCVYARVCVCVCERERESRSAQASTLESVQVSTGWEMTITTEILEWLFMQDSCSNLHRGFILILCISARYLNLISFTYEASSVKWETMIITPLIFHTSMMVLQIKCCKDCVLMWKWDCVSKVAVPNEPLGPFSFLFALVWGGDSLMAHELDDWGGFFRPPQLAHQPDPVST